jgi:hypothetical protein
VRQLFHLEQTVAVYNFLYGSSMFWEVTENSYQQNHNFTIIEQTTRNVGPVVLLAKDFSIREWKLGSPTHNNSLWDSSATKYIHNVLLITHTIRGR